MVKQIVAGIAVAAIAVSVAGCGGSGSQGTTANAASSGDTETTTTTGAANDLSGTLESFAKTANIDKTVIYDENDVKITATDLTYDDYEAKLNLKFKNDTDTDLNFCANIIGYSLNAINEYMIEDGYINLDVEAGKTGEESIDFDYDELLLHGISEIAEIQVGFKITDDDNDVNIHTGSLTIKTDLADSYDFDNNNYATAIQNEALQYTYGYTLEYFKQDEVYNSNGVSIISEGYMVNSSGDRVLALEIENDSDALVYFKTRDIKINDILAYESLWSSDCIAAGKKLILNINLDNTMDEEGWEKSGITEIESVGFTAYAEDNGWTDVAEPKDITISLK